MKGAFAEDKLSAFLNDLISGGVALDDLKNKPIFKKVDKWDGKDAPPIEVRFKSFNIYSDNFGGVVRIISSRSLVILNEACVS